MSSCNKQDKIDTIPGVADPFNNGSMSTIQISNIPEKSAGLYSDIYSDVRYIALESGPNSMIGEVNKIQVTKNNDLLIFDKKAKLVLLFDSNGKFKSKIGDAGHAENEYLEPLDITYDEFRDNVIIYDNAKKILSYYDMDGKYLHKIHLNGYIENFEILDKEHIVLYKNFGEISENKEVPNYVIINTKGKTVKEFAFYDKRMNGIMILPDVFYKKRNKLYCHIPTTPIVNEVTLNSLIPIYNINFSNYQVPNEWYTQGNKTYTDKVVSLSPNKAVSEHFFQTDNHTLMTFVYCNKNNFSRKYLMVANNNAPTNSLCYSLLINDMYGKQSSNDLKYAYKNKAYFIINPSYIQSLDGWESNKDISKLMAKTDHDILDKLPDGQPSKQDFLNMIEIKERKTTKIVISDEEKELIKRLKKSGNPIIQVCALKCR